MDCVCFVKTFFDGTFTLINSFNTKSRFLVTSFYHFDLKIVGLVVVKVCIIIFCCSFDRT